MIGMLRRWIKRIADEDRLAPAVESAGPPMIQIYKIENGYLIHKRDTKSTYADSARIVYCNTPIDVARQIINSEALQKMGITPEGLHTSGVSTGSFATKI
jgi:hypothetical protein